MENGFRVGFCVSGHGRLFRAAAVHSTNLGIDPTLVVAEHKASDELDAFCEGRQIPFVRMERMKRQLFDERITQACIEAELDLLCLTFDKLIPPELVNHYHERIINVHMGLLPAFAGMRALDQALAAGVRFVGATIHEVDEEMDHGAIIAQCVIGVRGNDTAALLGTRLFGILRLMYLQVIAWYVEGRITRDEDRRIWVRDAVYGELPVSPAIEQSFPD